jgi:predicted SAM-dependent methyltransferase
MNMSDIKLNIGCGPSGKIPGFINIDNSKAALLHQWPLVKKMLYRFGLLSEEKYTSNWDGVHYLDASRHLPFATGTVAKIFSSHFLEHIPLEKGTKALHECYRVLRPAGVMRMVLPDLLWHAEEYAMETNRLLHAGQKSFTPKIHDEFLDTVYGAYLAPARFGLLHCYMYDYPTIHCLLSTIGFRQISHFEYKMGADNELFRYDSRPQDSMHIECIK